MQADLLVAVKGFHSVSYLKKTIDIPFVPCAGMWLSGVRHAFQEEPSVLIQSVEWNAIDQRLTIDLAENGDSNAEHDGRFAIEIVAANWGADWEVL